MNSKVDYASIKSMARELGCPVTDLIVLAPQNDPFYVGTPGDCALGEWFAELWERFGYTTGVHLRRVHYRLVSQDPPVLTPSGAPYENTENCWSLLGRASKAARYLGLVDAADFDDRRNPDPVLYAIPEPSEPWLHIYDDDAWGTPGLPDFPAAPSYSLTSYAARQPYLLEVWCEKSTMNDVLAPLCQRYGANLATALGEFSVTAVLAAAERIRQDGRPAVLLYISDFDPAGQCMPVSVARKMEYFVRELELRQTVRLVPVVLSVEQCQEYQLPRTPIKATERRGAGFEGRFGEGATELDALEALHPGALAQIVRDALDAYCDPTLVERVDAEREELEERMQERQEGVLAEYQESIDELSDEYEALSEEIEGRLADHHKRRRAVWLAIRERLGEAMPVLEDYPVPAPEPVAGLGEALYDSERGYVEQVGVYKAFQGRE